VSKTGKLRDGNESTAEGFGGPYAPGSIDIGTAIIYAIAFAGLFLTSAGRSLGLDHYLTPRLGRFAFLASGSINGKHN
jgi:thiosulfate dehydrogenase (quinone) large subunit